MKISIITVVFNGEQFIEDCIRSVLAQTYSEIEYIIIDGDSTDSTSSIINKYKDQVDIIVSEKDNGLYDAINKGIRLASGDVVGLLNADDMLADDSVIEKIAHLMSNSVNLDGVYGDLNYIHPLSHKILRKWKSKVANHLDIENGWMPAHPTLYLKRAVFNEFGYYSLNFGTAADYDLIIRFFHTHRLKVSYLPILMVKMRSGGVSNNSLSARYVALNNDFKALKSNNIEYPLMVLFKKKIVKLLQFRI